MVEFQKFEHKHLHERRTGRIENRQSYYVLARSGKDKMLWGPYVSQEQADRVGMTRANGNYQTIPLPTSDAAAAAQILRERGIIEDGLSSDSFRRFRHT